MHINSETILQKGFRLPSCSASAGLLADSIDENQKKTTFAGERGDADVQVAFLLCNCRALGGAESIDENPKKTMFAYNFLNVLRTEPGQNIATVLEPVAKCILPTPPFNPQIQCCLGLCSDAVYCNIKFLMNSHGLKDHITKTIRKCKELGARPTLRSNKSKQTPKNKRQRRVTVVFECFLCGVGSCAILKMGVKGEMRTRGHHSQY